MELPNDPVDTEKSTKLVEEVQDNDAKTTQNRSFSQAIYARKFEVFILGLIVLLTLRKRCRNQNFP